MSEWGGAWVTTLTAASSSSVVRPMADTTATTLRPFSISALTSAATSR